MLGCINQTYHRHLALYLQAPLESVTFIWYVTCCCVLNDLSNGRQLMLFYFILYYRGKCGIADASLVHDALFKNVTPFFKKKKNNHQATLLLITTNSTDTQFQVPFLGFDLTNTKSFISLRLKLCFSFFLHFVGGVTPG